MTSPAFAGHPFGTVVTEKTLRQTFGALSAWEDKYRQLIMLGKQLPAATDEIKAQAQEIPGCENRVWLGSTRLPDGTLHFFGDSEGRIVRGLLAVLLTAVEGKRPQSLIENDPLALFDELGLRNQLSASRSQGLAALAAAVQEQARQALA
ncbi:cysteine desulfurase sulfur acceptor subunit CsdE [Kosakonia cowanii]|uniref:cysteine desulfurase sulfur acceptor subunit CsdE n=1 Tax=Kosakonia cowanii TaxID=208223 RepID=UPI0022E3EB77|nr:cysteine desulfurase sulfur acceptor subunit CsdE [Kosakonia cowanii]